jgi:hypothetical protein
VQILVLTLLPNIGKPITDMIYFDGMLIFSIIEKELLKQTAKIFVLIITDSSPIIFDTVV